MPDGTSPLACGSVEEELLFDPSGELPITLISDPFSTENVPSTTKSPAMVVLPRVVSPKDFRELDISKSYAVSLSNTSAEEVTVRSASIAESEASSKSGGVKSRLSTSKESSSARREAEEELS